MLPTFNYRVVDTIDSAIAFFFHRLINGATGNEIIGRINAAAAFTNYLQKINDSNKVKVDYIFLSGVSQFLLHAECVNKLEHAKALIKLFYLLFHHQDNASRSSLYFLRYVNMIETLDPAGYTVHGFQREYMLHAGMPDLCTIFAEIKKDVATIPGPGLTIKHFIS